MGRAVHRYMYCAIDEAGSHVGSKSFRLVVGVYSQTGEDLLGSACSQPIRVMANNDILKGAAHIPLIVNIRCCYLQTYMTPSRYLEIQFCCGRMCQRQRKRKLSMLHFSIRECLERLYNSLKCVQSMPMTGFYA